MFVTESYPTLFSPMDCRLPGSSFHGIPQARIMKWKAILFTRVSSWPRNPNPGLLHCRWLLYCRSHQGNPYFCLGQTKLLQLCSTLWDPVDCSLPGSCIHGIPQARILEWVAIPFFRGSSWCRDRIPVFCIAGWFFTIWATREAPEDEIVKEHHWLNGCEFEQTPGDSEDREAWHAAVHRVTKSRTQLSDGTTASRDKLGVSNHTITDFCLSFKSELKLKTFARGLS